MNKVGVYLVQANAYERSRSIQFFSRLAATRKNNVQNPADLIDDNIQDLESDSQAQQSELE